MPTELPVDERGDASNFRMGFLLGEDQVVMDGRWNSRTLAWYLDFYELDLTPIVNGVKVVLGVNLARSCTHRIFSRNILRALDTTRKGREATFDDFGYRVVIIQYTTAELYGTT